MRINPNESALKYQKCIIKAHLGYFHHSNFKFKKKNVIFIDETWQFPE